MVKLFCAALFFLIAVDGIEVSKQWRIGKNGIEFSISWGKSGNAKPSKSAKETTSATDDGKVVKNNVQSEAMIMNDQESHADFVADKEEEEEEDEGQEEESSSSEETKDGASIYRSNNELSKFTQNLPKRSEPIRDGTKEWNNIKYLVYLAHRKRISPAGSGIIISPFWILTAAHCVCKDAGVPVPQYIKTGHTNLFKIPITREIGSIICHENYEHYLRNNKSYAINDIALVKLNESIELSGEQQSAVLNGSPMNNFVNKTVGVTGLGLLKSPLEPNFTRHDGQLRKGISKILPVQECRNLWNDWYHDKDYDSEKIFCAGTVKGTPCQGDSGSPVMMDNEVVYGIVSLGSLWCNGTYFCVSVANYKEWILQRVETANFLYL